ncbi:MAG: hypothetical protein CVV61_04670 [Tenericutes bacterium HGW-Tenericutes-6]|nr:MAG: hypothetical protein CVV61_04670 [Tenericutes bacterium HGW-Tenericutes-6]
MPSQTFFNLNQAKKERIMEAAIDEMSMHSYEYINLANIIRNAHIPRGSFYQYFEDKDDLCNYFYRYIGEKKMAFFGDLFLPSHDIPLLERFKLIYLKGFEFAKAYPKLMKAGQKMIGSEYYQKNAFVKDAMKQAILLYQNYIEIDQKKGRIRKDVDSHILASFLLEFMNKVTLDAFLKDDIDYKEIEKAVNGLLDILKKGIDVHV